MCDHAFVSSFKTISGIGAPIRATHVSEFWVIKQIVQKNWHTQPKMYSSDRFEHSLVQYKIKVLWCCICWHTKSNHPKRALPIAFCLEKLFCLLLVRNECFVILWYAAFCKFESCHLLAISEADRFSNRFMRNLLKWTHFDVELVVYGPM